MGSPEEILEGSPQGILGGLAGYSVALALAPNEAGSIGAVRGALPCPLMAGGLRSRSPASLWEPLRFPPCSE